MSGPLDSSTEEFGRLVCCPICLDAYPWPTNAPCHEFDEQAGEFVEVDLSTIAGSVKRDAVLRGAYVRCPNPSQDMDTHYLPAMYATYNEPLVIGLVGATQTGKSHLLAAIIAAIESGGLQSHGLTVKPLDFAQHAAFVRNQVDKLLVEHDLLSGTVENVVSYADALLISSSTGTWPVAFFDVAGGDLVQHGKPSRFVAGSNALIFVVDPDRALATDADRKALTDPAFANVLGQLGAGRQYLEVPAAVVGSKPDRYRLRAPVDTWIARPDSQQLDAGLNREESRDAYAYLYQHDAHAWLRPFHECRRCTLHFASATGGNPVDAGYPRGVRPRRVLEPLVALLAMAGVISGPGATEVGVW